MKEIKTEHGIFTDLMDRGGNVIKTAQEYYEWWIEQSKVDTRPTLTDKERITKLEEEKSILAENVYQLASILEIMLGGVNNE